MHCLLNVNYVVIYLRYLYVCLPADALTFPVCSGGVLNSGSDDYSAYRGDDDGGDDRLDTPHASSSTLSGSSTSTGSSSSSKVRGTTGVSGPPAWQAGLSRQARTLLAIHQRIKHSPEYTVNIERYYADRGTTRHAAASALRARFSADVSVESSGFISRSQTHRAAGRGRVLVETDDASSAASDDAVGGGVRYDPCTQDYTTGDCCFSLTSLSPYRT